MVTDLALLGVEMPRKTKAQKAAEESTAAAAEAAVATQPAVPDANGVYGELTEQAKMALGQIQNQQQQLTLQVGHIEVQKNGFMKNLDALQGQAKRILDSEASRLGIAPGTPWQVTPDGNARKMG